MFVLFMPACAPQETEKTQDKELEELREQVQESEEQEEPTSELDTEPVAEGKVVEVYTGESSIELVSPTSGERFREEPVTFIGTVSPNVTKIVVTAYYYDNPFEDTERSTDVYTLTQFTPGDTTFTYRAKMEWNNLGFRENDYLFTAYFDDGRQKSVSVSISFDAEELVNQ